MHECHHAVCGDKPRHADHKSSESTSMSPESTSMSPPMSPFAKLSLALCHTSLLPTSTFLSTFSTTHSRISWEACAACWVGSWTPGVTYAWSSNSLASVWLSVSRVRWSAWFVCLLSRFWVMSSPHFGVESGCGGSSGGVFCICSPTLSTLAVKVPGPPGATSEALGGLLFALLPRSLSWPQFSSSAPAASSRFVLPAPFKATSVPLLSSLAVRDAERFLAETEVEVVCERITLWCASSVGILRWPCCLATFITWRRAASLYLERNRFSWMKRQCVLCESAHLNVEPA
mmetsp:Transcript_6547/g.14921  ORF Transcript_6547/g.14921 Transcript_6547/m.14921 type:complete len:288 (+) Transcript_6547:62-925(+)